MIHSNVPKRPTVLAAVGLAFVALVLSFALSPTPASAHCKGKHVTRDDHDCPVDPPPTPGDPPIIEDCVVGLCIADVGLKGTAPDDGPGRPAEGDG